MYVFYAEKMLSICVLLIAIIVGVTTIHHGDIYLGLLVLTGQIQSHLAGHGHGHNVGTHIAVHKH